MAIAIIGGTGIYHPQWLQNTEELEVSTPYGSAQVTRGQAPGVLSAVYFMNRHGKGHRVPPHLVNYRANLFALKSLGVTRVVATAAVGSLNRAMAPGTLVYCDQFLDFTKSRVNTFFDGGPAGVVHTDMTEAYCPDMRDRLLQAASGLSIAAINGGTYVATEGPRFESPAEIRAYRMLGGDVVGMTGIPEVVLARELGLCYATIALVTNFAAGIAAAPLTHQEVLEVMAQYADRVRALLTVALPRMTEPKSCRCADFAPPLPG